LHANATVDATLAISSSRGDKVMMSMCVRVLRKQLCVAMASAMLTLMMLTVPTVARAQTAAAPADPNPGALTFTGGLDVPSKYIFRGIVQEADSKLTLFPYGDLGIAVYSGSGALKSATVNFGVWNALLTGSSGLDGPQNKLHYEEDFYATFGLGFDHGISLATTYTAYTSPNGMFPTVQELGFKVAKTHWLNPYGIIAFELDGQADAGANKGTYLELGVGPSWPLAGGKATIGVPVKLGLSLNDYYEGIDGDSKFGYIDVGGLLTLPLGSATSKFGAWNLHGGVDIYGFGDTTKAFNAGDGSKVVVSFGIGVVY
jgi:hypothetical protein